MPLFKMENFGCFAVLIRKKKKPKEDDDECSDSFNSKNENGTLNIKLEHSINACMPLLKQNSGKVKVVSEEDSPEAETLDAAHEGRYKHEDRLDSIKGQFSHFDLIDHKGLELSLGQKMDADKSVDTEMNDKLESRPETETPLGAELILNGHVSDLRTEKARFWHSPTLERSCSNVESNDMLRKMFLLKDSSSQVDVQNLKAATTDEKQSWQPGISNTHCSADRVMLKKHISCQILPTRGKVLREILHLGPQKPAQSTGGETKGSPANQKSDQKDQCCVDTLEPIKAKEKHRSESPISFKGDTRKLNKFPENHGVAFPGSSSLTRVDEWVNSLDDKLKDEDKGDEVINFPSTPENSISPSRSMSHVACRNHIRSSKELFHANSVIQSLDSSSTIAHIVRMNLKVIPTASRFSSLRSLNLSGNLIACITLGSLPKGLHTLNLSRNKIVVIEGLRHLTRIRVLDLSYNVITRIGHGLSSCTLVKELYLAGNKISYIEGLHRLMKLTAVDLSFNKITTTKALGPLVANYNSLLALNLLGNPIQNNIGDGDMRKVVSSLLLKLAYLNKQPINPFRGRELVMDSFAKAALRDNEWSSCRKMQKRIGPRRSLDSSGVKSNLGGIKTRHRSNSGGHNQSPEKCQYTLASSSR